MIEERVPEKTDHKGKERKNIKVRRVKAVHAAIFKNAAKEVKVGEKKKVEGNVDGIKNLRNEQWAEKKGGGRGGDYHVDLRGTHVR